jgi:hypothetical protein
MPYSVMIPKASDTYISIRHSVLRHLGNSVSRNYLVFHAGFCCRLAFDMVLTVRASSYFTIPSSANLLSVSSAFITYTISLVINVDLSMSFGSWTASSSFELSIIRTKLLVVCPVAASLTA